MLVQGLGLVALIHEVLRGGNQEKLTFEEGLGACRSEPCKYQEEEYTRESKWFLQKSSCQDLM